MENNKFVPIWQFCKEREVNRQKVYRLIRENKIPKKDIKKQKVELERLFINIDTKI